MFATFQTPPRSKKQYMQQITFCSQQNIRSVPPYITKKAITSNTCAEDIAGILETIIYKSSKEVAQVFS
jgi:hypothetical protein